MSTPVQNFRHEARRGLARADERLATDDVEDLKYTALELRMAMEALTYDRAQAYAAELPPDEYDTWQPKKLLALLLELDPTADADATYAVGREGGDGGPPREMRPLGMERVLNVAILKKHYDALGSYLHVPTLKQYASGKGIDYARIAERCRTVAEFVRAALASPVFNVTLGAFSKLRCQECGAAIRKRLPMGSTALEARCFSCLASYRLERDGAGKVLWKPQQEQIPCAAPGCGKVAFIWRHEIAPGRFWTCSACAARNEFAIGIVLRQAGVAAEAPSPPDAART